MLATMILTVAESGTFLEKECWEVDPTDTETRATADALAATAAELERTVTDCRVAGLAANQIGHDAAVFIARLSVEDGRLSDDFTVCVNPQILYHVLPDRTIGSVLDSAVSVEGCYSLPDEYYAVRRHMVITAFWFDLEGERYSATLAGLPAVVFQHETGHLNGEHIKQIGLRVRERAAPSGPAHSAVREIESLRQAGVWRHKCDRCGVLADSREELDGVPCKLPASQ